MLREMADWLRPVSSHSRAALMPLCWAISRNTRGSCMAISGLSSRKRSRAASRADRGDRADGWTSVDAGFKQGLRAFLNGVRRLKEWVRLVVEDFAGLSEPLQGTVQARPPRGDIAF